MHWENILLRGFRTLPKIHDGASLKTRIYSKNDKFVTSICKKQLLVAF